MTQFLPEVLVISTVHIRTQFLLKLYLFLDCGVTVHCVESTRMMGTGFTHSRSPLSSERRHLNCDVSLQARREVNQNRDWLRRMSQVWPILYHSISLYRPDVF